MKRLSFESADFLKSAPDVVSCPVLQDSQGTPMSEIVFLGRSNVGKSSLINHLVRKKGLAKTSSTPGKTALLNFFLIDKRLLFVDLPGYGYAKGGLDQRQSWKEMIEAFLIERDTNRLFLFLLDIRHLPSTEDIKMAQWLSGKPTVIVFTKTDKIKEREKEAQTRAILAALGCSRANHVHYSIHEGEGREQLISLMYEILP